MSLGSRVRVLFAVDHPSFVWLVSLTHGFNEFFSIVIPPLFPFLVPELAISYVDASLLLVAFFVTSSIFQLPVGRIVDRYSPRRLLVVGMIGLSGGIAVVAVADSFGLMVAGMVVAGLGASTYHPTGMSIISDIESETTHGRSMGIHGTLGAMGPVAAPVVMTTGAVLYGWRTALLLGSVVGIVFSIILYVMYPRALPVGGRGQPDSGFLVTVRSEFDSTSIRTGLIRAWQFVRSPSILALIGLFTIVGAEVRAVQVFTPVFGSDLVGSDPAFGNGMLTVTMVAAALASLGGGYWVDRVDRRLFVAGCFSGTAIVVAGLVFVPLGRAFLPVAFVVLGIVLYSIYPAVNAIAAGTSTPERSGSVFAVTNTAAALGGAAGPLILGLAADATSLRLGFLATTGIAIAGLGVIAVAGRRFV